MLVFCQGIATPGDVSSSTINVERFGPSIELNGIDQGIAKIDEFGSSWKF